MRLLTDLLFKVTLSSMILTAPAMITGNIKDDNGNTFLRDRKGPRPFFTSAVIKKFVDHPSVIAMRATPAPATVRESPAPENSADKALTADKGLTAERALTAGKAAELRMVINQANLIYMAMDLESSGLDQKAFEYAWRGYRNLLKKGVIHKKAVLSICDFSQSSRNKRMYVIDVRHKRLLYRTYVAHGQNSGDEFATTFSNSTDSYMSSLGFYVTQRTYVGRNGLSLKLSGVDSGYNDMALKRKIVLHGASYVSEKYMEDYGTPGTSLGCPALPSAVSARIIRTVKDGSCLFIYHPTQQYLDNSTIIHG